MTKKLIEIYEKKIDSIKNNKNTISIFLVGSSKNKFNENKLDDIKDIDIFIICNQSENQIRLNETIDDLDFDINKFSIQYVNKLIKDKEYFFINEMKDAKVLYDTGNIGSEFVFLSKKVYDDGPNKVSKDEIVVMRNTIYDNISRLRKKDKFENFEYEFLTNMYVKDIIKGYFVLNCRWMPKYKKLFKYLKENDKNLFELLKNIYTDYKYENIKKLYDYVFDSI